MILSAVMYLGKETFTGNEIAEILVEQFALPKTLFKAKAFTYQQLTLLIKKHALTKNKIKGAYQYEYSKAANFQDTVASVKLCQPGSLSASQDDDHGLSAYKRPEGDSSGTVLKLKSVQKKYEHALSQVIGEKNAYEELINDLPEHKAEFLSLLNTLKSQESRLIGKLLVLNKFIKNYS